MAKDADGMKRVNLEWTIEGKKIHGTRTGKMYGLHFAERMSAEQTIRKMARRGDTVTIKEF